MREAVQSTLTSSAAVVKKLISIVLDVFLLSVFISRVQSTPIVPRYVLDLLDTETERCRFARHQLTVPDSVRKDPRVSQTHRSRLEELLH